MFVSSGQIYVFLSCVAFGGVSGSVVGFSESIKKICKNKILSVIISVISFIIVGFLYVAYSSRMKFPSLRWYMIVGVLAGIVAYFKSFHIILAKCEKLIYNIIVKIFSKVKNGPSKSKKSDNRNDGGSRASCGNTGVHNGISVNINVYKK